jgi:molybdopterin-guanine dinucleotide biosynthesis protein A
VTDAWAWDAIIVAGGGARRLGGASKPELVVGGTALLDRAIDAVTGARSVVTVGGPQRDGIAWTVEEPPGSGPAAAIAAGLVALENAPAPWTVVLGVDTPRAADAVPVLLAARAGDGAWIVDADGREQPLVAVYRTAALRDATGGLAASGALVGASLRALTSELDMAPVPDAHGAARDLDTWEDARYWEGVFG